MRTRKKLTKTLKIKLGYYIFLMILATLVMIMNSTNMLAYHMLGFVFFNKHL